MNNYGGIIVPSLNFTRKRAMIYEFFMANPKFFCGLRIACLYSTT